MVFSPSPFSYVNSFEKQNLRGTLVDNFIYIYIPFLKNKLTMKT